MQHRQGGQKKAGIRPVRRHRKTDRPAWARRHWASLAARVEKECTIVDRSASWNTSIHNKLLCGVGKVGTDLKKNRLKTACRNKKDKDLGPWALASGGAAVVV